MSEASSQRGHRLFGWLLALMVGALGVWLQHRHQFASEFDLFPGPRGDTRLTAYLCENWYQSLQGKADVLSPAMFYPVNGTLGYTDALLVFVPPFAALRMVGLDVFTALAATVVVYNFLNFVVGLALLFGALRLGWLSSVAGAMFFAFNNPKLSDSDHLQLQPVWLLALIAICVVVFWRDADQIGSCRAFLLLLLAGLLVDAQLLTGFYPGWFLIFWALIFLGLIMGVSPTRRRLLGVVKKHRWAIVAAGVITVLGLAPFFTIYWPVWRMTGGWPYSMALRYIPDGRSYLLMADGNFVWSRATEAILRASGNGLDWGRRIGIGLVPLLSWLWLTAVAVRRLIKTPDREPLLTLAILSVNLLALLAFQFHGHSLWHVVYKVMPGAQGIRAIERFSIVMALPMAVIFAFAIQRAWSETRTPMRAILVAAVVFGLFEQFNRGEGDYFSIRAENAHLRRLAAKLPDGCAAFYVTARWPADQPLDSFQNQQWMHDAMLVSLMRGVPTLNGRSGKSPPGWNLREVLAPDYEQRVQDWVARNKLTGRICRLEIDD